MAVVNSKMFMNFVCDLKKCSKLLKAKVKKDLRNEDLDVDDMAKQLLQQLKAVHGNGVFDKADFLRDEELRKVRILPHMTVGYVADALSDGVNTRCLQQHIVMLTMMAVNADNVTEALQTVQECQNQTYAGNDKLAKVLCGLYDVEQAAPLPIAQLESMFANTRIGDLAKEIAGEIDVSSLAKLDTANPASMFSLQSLTDSNSPLASIVSSVGSKIQTKLSNGELKHEELLSEAMGMLQFVSPQMLSMFGNPGAAPPASKSGSV